ncbi:Aminotransferase-like plant mobile domain family protein [Euphorbia peplus]|nr:Aminotransferase-like plant mobile domain family protein [Euphorbia peplus]
METGVATSEPADGSISLIEEEDIDPGPVDASVLYDQDNHVSTAIWEGQERGVLRCHEHTSKLGEWRLTQQQIELVEKAGFGYLRKLPSISLDNPLISALVERWRKETNSFHFLIGEMSITLEDVALLLGLPIDGEPVLGVTYTSCKAVCEKFLGRVPDGGYMSGGMVKLSWLKEYFTLCPEDGPMEEIERYTRAYLLYLVGSTIFSTTTGNKVPIMYLPLFEDFEKAGKYAWGAATLAFLYRALGKATLKSQSTISGCLTLLQCWSYFHLNIGRPRFYQEPVHDCFPFVLWWKGKQSAATVKRDINFYRKALDSLEPCDVDWVPYSNIDDRLIPEHLRNSLILGRSQTMLICFDKAERHLPDRCSRQHGMLQRIPEDVQQWERKSRGVDSGVDLSGKMEAELNEWADRQNHIVQDDGDADESEYMHWYLRMTRKFVGRPMSSLPPIQRTVKFRTKKKRVNSGLRDIAYIADTFVTQGLDPIQMESISRIRAIIHDCLGDTGMEGAVLVSASPIVSSPLVVSPSPTMYPPPEVPAPVETEQGKRKREKEHVRRNTKAKGKHKRKDEAVQYFSPRDFNPVQFYGAAFGGDPLHCCHCHIRHSQVATCHVDHFSHKLGKKMRKKEKGRKKSSKKTSQKHKRKDDDIAKSDSADEEFQYEEVEGTAEEDNQIQLCDANSMYDQVQLFDAADEVKSPQPRNPDGESDHPQPCDTAVEG